MLLTKNGNGYTNDANGNTLTGGGRTLTWDGQNRLTQCVNNSTTTTHTYGSDGLRRRTVQGSTTTDFILDGQSVVRTLTNGVLDRTFLHGARGPEYERIGANAPGWYAYDGLGSVLGIVDAGGNLTSVRKYDVYGAVRALTGPSGSKHKWVGGLGHPSEDETGLVYMRARYYDPAVGRFASEDPAKDGANWFAYCNNNAVGLIDADGKRGVRVEHPGLAALGFLICKALIAAFAIVPFEAWTGVAFSLATTALTLVAGMFSGALLGMPLPEGVSERLWRSTTYQTAVRGLVACAVSLGKLSAYAGLATAGGMMMAHAVACWSAAFLVDEGM